MNDGRCIIVIQNESNIQIKQNDVCCQAAIDKNNRNFKEV